MGGIASGAYFLVSPMLAVNQPIGVASHSAIVGPASIQAQLGVVPIVGYLPDQHDRKTLGQIVVEQVRRQLEEQPEPVAALWPADGTTDVGIDAEEPKDHDAAVVAAHGQRISILRERLNAARVQRVGRPLLADLQMRLRRAEAAQRLALARAEAHRSVGLMASRDPERATSARPHLAELTTLRTRHSPSSRDQFAQTIRETSAKHLLAQARQSLAAARTALDTTTGRSKQAASVPTIRIAGLLQWSGSEHWSLDGPQRLS